MISPPRPIRKVLIANRGEIARRINRSLRAQGYRTVAAASEADIAAAWLKEASETKLIGPAAPAESYLSISRLIDAALETGADAVHPGYGFLSENAAFARACIDAGLVFIGPEPDVIEAMASKSNAKRIAEAAGAPIIPGYQGKKQDDATLQRAAEKIGFPLMVKAAAGGGGRGMRLVTTPEDLTAALRLARSEAENSFGSAELILERALLNGRHIEIQILADHHGNIVHLGERDCSSQRRHQKVIEESPSPAVTEALRARMGEAAVRIAAAAKYRNAGTVEFMLTEDGEFYFLEMNTRLQVEHPVTECVTGFDLVALQMHIAEGRPLPMRQDEIALRGHAIELRLYAEDADHGFLPQSGTLAAWDAPAMPGVRFDHALAAGQIVTPHYDPMLAKIIAHGSDREEARRRAVEALDRTIALGVTTNRRFLRRLLEDDVFVNGRVTTRYLDDGLLLREAGDASSPDALWSVAAVLTYQRHAWAGAAMLRGWSSTGVRKTPVTLGAEGARKRILISPKAGGFDVEYDGRVRRVVFAVEGENTLSGACDGAPFSVSFAFNGDELHLESAFAALTVSDVGRLRAGATDAEAGSTITAPMAGSITALLVQAGDSVQKGQPLLVLEAMKMQHELRAPADALVEAVRARIGEQVSSRQVLLTLTPKEPT